MSLVERLRERLKELKIRLKKPEEEEGWGTLEEQVEEVEEVEEVAKVEKKTMRLRVVLEGWFAWRWRVLGVASAVNVAVNIGLMVLLYSNTWYLNLMVFTFLVSNTVMLIHYRRLLRQAKG